MADEKQTNLELVPTANVDNLKFEGKTTRELIRGLMTSMSQSEKDWRDVFVDKPPVKDEPRFLGLTDLATGVRLADALKFPEKEAFLLRFKQMDKIHSQTNHEFSFKVAMKLLQTVHDDEYVKEWNLPEMSSDLRNWCVEVISERLTEIGDTEAPSTDEVLKEVGWLLSRIERSWNPDGSPDTYLTKDDGKKIREAISDWQGEKIEKAGNEELQNLISEFNRE